MPSLPRAKTPLRLAAQTRHLSPSLAQSGGYICARCRIVQQTRAKTFLAAARSQHPSLLVPQRCRAPSPSSFAQRRGVRDRAPGQPLPDEELTENQLKWRRRFWKKPEDSAPPVEEAVEEEMEQAEAEAAAAVEAEEARAAQRRPAGKKPARRVKDAVRRGKGNEVERVLAEAERESQGLPEDAGVLEEEGQEEEVPRPKRSSEYVPAQSWQGLKSFKPSEWDALMVYEGFNAPKQVKELDDVERAVHCALLEVFAMRQTGRPMAQIYSQRTSVIEYKHRAANQTSFQAGQNGAYKLTGEDTVVLDQENAPATATSAEGKEAETTALHITPTSDGKTKSKRLPKSRVKHVQAEPTEAENFALHGPLDQTWRKVPLVDPDLRFAVIKRTTQLLGLFVPDAQLGRVVDAVSLVAVLAKTASSSVKKKLFEQLMAKRSLDGLGNVEVHDKLQRPRDRDEEFGRKKIVEAELKKRGLV